MPQPTLAQMVDMMSEAMGEVQVVLPSSAPRLWAEYIVTKCYASISNWRHLVEEISDALNHKTWPIGEVDMDDVRTFIDEFNFRRGEVARRDRERILRTFLESVFSMKPEANA